MRTFSYLTYFYSYINRRSHTVYWFRLIHGFPSVGKSFKHTWSYKLVKELLFRLIACPYPHNLPRKDNSFRVGNLHNRIFSTSPGIAHGYLLLSSKVPTAKEESAAIEIFVVTFDKHFSLHAHSFSHPSPASMKLDGLSANQVQWELRPCRSLWV